MLEDELYIAKDKNLQIWQWNSKNYANQSIHLDTDLNTDI